MSKSNNVPKPQRPASQPSTSRQGGGGAPGPKYTIPCPKPKKIITFSCLKTILAFLFQTGSNRIPCAPDFLQDKKCKIDRLRFLPILLIKTILVLPSSSLSFLSGFIDVKMFTYSIASCSVNTSGLISNAMQKARSSSPVIFLFPVIIALNLLLSISKDGLMLFIFSHLVLLYMMFTVLS